MLYHHSVLQKATSSREKGLTLTEYPVGNTRYEYTLKVDRPSCSLILEQTQNVEKISCLGYLEGKTEKDSAVWEENNKLFASGDGKTLQRVHQVT